MVRRQTARRTWLKLAGASGMGLGLNLGFAGQSAAAEPWPVATQAAIAAFTGGQAWSEGLVQLQVESLVENGNVVPVRVAVPSADLARLAPGQRVQRLALFTERNPEAGVGVFELSAFSARAEVNTRMRLATSGRVLAMAQLTDGRCFGQAAQVMVTLAACIEE